MIFRLINTLLNESGCLALGDMTSRCESFPNTRRPDCVACSIEVIDLETYQPVARITFNAGDRRLSLSTTLGLCSIEYQDGTIESFGRIRATTAISNIYTKYKKDRGLPIEQDKVQKYEFFKGFN